jgi:hypothetical protein
MAADTRNTAVAERSLQLAGAANTRLFFAGPPTALAGAIPLINETDTKLKLRSLGLRSATLKGAAGLPLGEIPFFATLYPAEQATVPAMISLDPSTPPGDYQFDLTVGKQTVAVDAHVEEVVDLRITPSHITILAGRDTTYTRTLVADNAGNVDLPTGAECKAPVFDSHDITAAVVSGINDSDKSTVETMVKEILLHIGDLQAGTLIVRRDPIVVHPGQPVTADVSFHLPAELKPQRHYSANLQLYNATISVDIYTTADYGRKSTTRRKPKETAS